MISSEQSEFAYVSQPRERETALVGDGPSILLYVLAGLLIPVALAYALAVVDSEVRVTVVVLALMAAAAILVKPFWGLLFFVGLVYIRPEENYSDLQGLHLPLLVSILTLAALTLRLTLGGEPVVRAPTNGMLVGLFITGVLSCAQLGTDYMSGAFQDWLNLTLLVFLVMNLTRAPADYQSLVATVILLVAYLTITTINLHFAGTLQVASLEGHYDYQDRMGGTGIFSNPNELAASIVPGIAMALTRMVTSRGIRRPLYLIGAAAMAWAVLLTQSRGGLLALLAVGFMAVASQVRNKPLALILALLVCGAAYTGGSHTSSHMTDFDSQDESANNRFRYWDHGVEMMKSHPVFGVGFEQFADNNGGADAHNAFVKVFTEIGLPGFFFYMGLVYYCFRRPARKETMLGAPSWLISDLWGARVALVGYLVAAYWGNRAYTPIAFLLFGLPVAAMVVMGGARDPYGLKPIDLRKDWLFIILLCFGMFQLIEWMIGHYLYG